MILTIEFPKLRKNQFLTFSKLGLRKALAISRITTSAVIELDQNKNVIDVVMCSGSIGRYPMREPEVEEYLKGKEIKEETILGSIVVLEEAMRERLEGRSTFPYKSKAIKTILRETLEESINLKNEVKQ